MAKEFDTIEFERKIREEAKQTLPLELSRKNWQRIPENGRKIILNALGECIESTNPIAQMGTQTQEAILRALHISMYTHGPYRPISNSHLAGFLMEEAVFLREEGKTPIADHLENLSNQVSAITKPQKPKVVFQQI